MSEDIKCPKCGSTQISANKKGFSTGKAAAGAVLTGGVGLLAGTIGSNKVIVTCLKCGKQWEPKEYAKQQQQQEQQQAINAFKSWQNEFYSSYEKKEFEAAEQLYLLKFNFNELVPNVHKAYEQQKKNDAAAEKATLIFWLVFIAVIVLIFYWISR